MNYLTILIFSFNLIYIKGNAEFRNDELNGIIYTDTYCSPSHLRFNNQTIQNLYSQGVLDPCSNQNFEEEYLIQKFREFDCGYVNVEIGEFEKKTFSSGIIVGTGIDLSNFKPDLLSEMEVSVDLITKLTPYLGLFEKKAFEKIDIDPLYLTKEEERELSNKVFINKFNKLSNKYDKNRCENCTEKFSLLPIGIKSVIISTFLNNEFLFYWDDILNNDWKNYKLNPKNNLLDIDKSLIEASLKIKTHNSTQIAFIIEESLNVNELQFNKSKKFISDYITKNNISKENIALITFDSEINNIIKFNSDDILNRINNLNYKANGMGNEFLALDTAIKEFGNTNSLKTIVFLTSGHFNLSSTLEPRKFAHENNISIIFVTHDKIINPNIILAAEKKYFLSLGEFDKLKCIQDNIPYNSFIKPIYTPALENSTHRVDFYDRPNYHYTKTNISHNLNVTINIINKENKSDFINIVVSFSDNTNITKEISKNDILLSTNNTHVDTYKFEFILEKDCFNCSGNKFSFINVVSSGLEYSIYTSTCIECTQGVYVFLKGAPVSIKWLWILLIIISSILILYVLFLIWRLKKRSKLTPQVQTDYISMNL